MFKYSVICAHSWPEFGIGKLGQIPWHLKGDLANFKHLTTHSSEYVPSSGHDTSINTGILAQCPAGTVGMGLQSHDSGTPVPLNSLLSGPGLARSMNIVIMGRQTYDSLPKSVRPLPGRFNIIITNNPGLLENTPGPHEYIYYTTWSNMESTLELLASRYVYLTRQVFIIGGAEIYKLALETLSISQVFITEVYFTEKKDTGLFDKFFPVYDMLEWSVGLNKFALTHVSNIITEKETSYRYLTFKTANSQPGLNYWLSQEEQYLAIMKNILERGIERDDRTQVGTLSLFSTTQRYDLRDTFPLCTTKRMFFRAIYEELALYLSGRTDNKILQDAGIHIWDGNTSRDFLDKRGLKHYPDGDMGETYGFNFRHYGAKYENCKTELPLDGSIGYDQVANLIHLLKTEPTSRRMIINLWNPATQHKASLPACLMMYQFYVNTQAKTLNCQIYIRSSDYFLANNWNACTGALLVHMLCGLEGIDLIPGELIVVTGDTHIYKSHLAQVNLNLSRKPYPFPGLLIKGGKRSNITDFKFEDIRLVGYKAHPNIPAPMAV